MLTRMYFFSACNNLGVDQKYCFNVVIILVFWSEETAEIKAKLATAIDAELVLL